MKLVEQDYKGVYLRSWLADKPKAEIVLVHGLGEHCQRYDEFASFMTSNGYSVHSQDLVGHGRTHGKRGHIDSFNQYLRAVDKLVVRCRKKSSGRPMFLIGHSMGGLIATRYLQRKNADFNGAILSGAAIESPQEPPKWQVSLITFISKVMPRLPALQLDAQGISRDPMVVKEYMDDPLVSKDKLSAKLLVEMFNAMQGAKNDVKKLTLPMLIMHGSDDSLTRPNGSHWLAQNIKSDDKTLKIYDHLYHEIFNEPEGPEIFKEVLDWMNARC